MIKLLVVLLVFAAVFYLLVLFWAAAIAKGVDNKYCESDKILFSGNKKYLESDKQNIQHYSDSTSENCETSESNIQ